MNSKKVTLQAINTNLEFDENEELEESENASPWK